MMACISPFLLSLQCIVKGWKQDSFQIEILKWIIVSDQLEIGLQCSKLKAKSGYNPDLKAMRFTYGNLGLEGGAT